MSQDEVLRMVAVARDDASGAFRRIEDALRSLNKRGGEHAKQLSNNFSLVHEQLGKVRDVAREGVSPALEAIGLSSLTAVGAVAALVSGLRGFINQGADVAAFGRKVQLTSDTIRGLEGIADKFHVDPAELRAGEQAFANSMVQIRRHRGDLFASLKGRRLDFALELAATPESTAGNEQALQNFFKVLDDVRRRYGEMNARMFSKEMTGNDSFVDMLRDGLPTLEAARKEYLRLAGALDPEASKRFASSWSDFRASLEGLRNEVGGALLPDITELVKQTKEFFAQNRVEVGRDMVGTLREMGVVLRGVNAGVQEIGGWRTVFEGLVALKLASLAINISKVVGALGGFAGLAGPPGWVRAILAISTAGAAAEVSAVRNMKPEQRSALYTDPMAAMLNPDLALGAAIMDQTRERATASQRAAEVIKGLRERGLDPVHAAILAGNIQQESNFDPTLPNVGEGGIGLIQWRLDRRRALQEFAARRHALETDLPTQLDYLMSELHSPAGRAFNSAGTPEAINAALHRFIKYGDASEGARLNYGMRLLPLAEKTQPGSLLAAAGKAGIGGPVGTWMGSASVDVNFRNLPKGASVAASADGLFDRVRVDRGSVMPNFED
jgi:hypothetical protein